MTITTYEDDSLNIQVTVKDSGGSPKDLSSATVAASTNLAALGTINASSVTISDAANGVVDVAFSAGSLSGYVGLHKFQCVATIGSQVQTVVEEDIDVRRSN